jgi:hypothetical protein
VFHRKRRIAATLGAVVATLPALAACGGDDAGGPVTLPTRTATTSTSPSATTTPSPTTPPPVKPPGADANTAAGMKAFTQYAIDAINYAYSAGQTEPLRSISTAACDPCNAVIKEVERAWSKGGQTTGSQIDPTNPSTPGPLKGVRPSVSVDVSISAYQELDENGRVVDKTPAVRGTQYIFDLQRGEETWRLDNIRRGASSAS